MNRYDFCPSLALLLLFSFCLNAEERGGSILPVQLKTESIVSPSGVDTPYPRLTWELEGEAPGAAQSAFRVTLAQTAEDLLSSPLWDTGWIEPFDSRIPSNQMAILYGGPALKSDTDYLWQVEVKDAFGQESVAAEPARFSTGILPPDQLAGEWICRPAYFPGDLRKGNFPPDPYFRKNFHLSAQPVRAYLFLASIGYHELYVNGQKVGNGCLAPHVSDLVNRALYIDYDIQPYLRQGTNTIAVWLGAGWSVYAYYQTPNRPKCPLFKGQTHILLENGESVDIQTDGEWKTAPSGNTLVGFWDYMFFGGEQIIEAQMIPNWNQTDFDDSSWENVRVVPLWNNDYATTAQMGPQNLQQEPIHPITITKTEEGWRADMGTNYTGWTRIHYKGTPGKPIEVQFSESPFLTLTHQNHSFITPDETGEGVFCNRFNYAAGRWITITGLEEAPKPEDITGWLIRTGYDRVAEFECSDELQNWIYETTLHTYEDLTLGGYIVDCPQRERCGYGGDAHASIETGMFNFDQEYFFRNWLQSWRDIQGWVPDWLKNGPQPVEEKKEDAYQGVLANTAPNRSGAGGPAWGGISVTLPWAHYLQYGDKRVLEENYEMSKKWLGFLNAFVQDDLLYPYGSFLGDWLWPGAEKRFNITDPDALCFNNMYRVINLMTGVKIARTLGKESQAQEWEAQANAARRAIHQKYFHSEDASYFDGRMAIQAAALLAEIPPQEERDRVMKRLEEEILVQQKGHIWVGITGGAILFHLLRQEHRDDLIWSMLSQKEYPGFGFMRDNDGTTLWEAWEANRERCTLIHSSFLFAGVWYIDSVLGIRAEEEQPGFQGIVIRPPKLNATSLLWARGSYHAVTGKIKVDWKKANGGIVLNVSIPANTTAKVFLPLPDLTAEIEASGGKKIATEDGYAIFQVPSGSYQFVSKGE